MMILLVCTDVKTHQIKHFKEIQFIVCQLYFQKAVKKILFTLAIAWKI